MASDETLSILLQLEDGLTEPLNRISDRISRFGDDVMALGTTLLTLDTAFKVFDTAADAADKLQDVSRALTTFTGSAQAGAEALAFFQKAQDETRSTALQLADMYTRILPLGIRQGWSQAGLQEITVELDQLAAAAGRAPEEMQAAFTRLLSSGGGRGAGRNALLQVLGITSQDLQAAGEDAGQVLAQAIQSKIAALGGSVPDSLHSAWEKAKDDLATALGQGFESTFGQGSDAMKSLRDMFKDPELLQDIRDLGRVLGLALQDAIMLFKAGAYNVQQAGTGLSAMGERLGYGSPPSGGWQSGSPASADAYIAWLRQQSGRASQGDSQYYSNFYGGLDMPTLPALDPGPSSLLQGGVGQLGAAGKAVQAADDISKLTKALADLTANYWATLAADKGLSDEAFSEQHKSDLQKLADLTSNYGVSVDGLTRSFMDLAQAARPLPQGDTFSKFLQTQGTTVPTSFMGLQQSEDGSWVLSPDFVAKEDYLLTQFSNRQSELNVQVEQESERQQLAGLTRLAAAWKQEFSNVFSDLFADLATTGGANIGKILEAQLSNSAKRFGQDLADMLGTALGKAIAGNISVDQINPATGKNYTPAEVAAANQQGLATAVPVGGAVFNVAALGYQLSQGGMSPLQGAISGASAGYSVGTAVGALTATTGAEAGSMAGPVGALIGAFVGALVAALTEAMPSITTYAVPVIRNGMAELGGMVGEIASDPAQQQAWLQKIQTSFDNFRNGYANILLSLPDSIKDSVMPELIKVLTRIATGVDPRGDLGGSLSTAFPSPYANVSQSGPSGGYITAQDWQSMMNNWVGSSMPAQVQSVFQPAFQDAFLAMGGTLDKFNEIWAKAKGLNAQDALNYLSSYFSVLSTMQDLMTKIAQPVNVGGRDSGLFADTLAKGSESFAQQLQDADKNILDLGNNLQYLTGQSQIDSAKQLNTLIQNRYQLEQQMVQQIVSMIQSAQAGLESNLLTVSLRGKTPQQQYGIYQTQLTSLEGELPTITDPTQAQTIYNQIVQTIMTMSGLFPNSASIQTWAAKELTSAEHQFELVMGRMGQAIDTANTQFEHQMRPIIDLFTTTTNQFAIDLTTASGSMTALNSATTQLTTSFSNLVDVADFLASKAAAFGYTASTRRARGVS